jgi:hypothetical protein
MNPSIGNYDPKKVVLTFGGFAFSGYVKGSFIEVAPNDADGFKKQVGADGEISRSQSNDNTHQVTVTLMQNSASNTYLSGIRNSDKLAGKSILPLAITDLSGSFIGFWPQAWIRGDPTWGFGDEVTDRQWIIDTGQIATDEKSGLLP